MLRLIIFLHFKNFCMILTISISVRIRDAFILYTLSIYIYTSHFVTGNFSLPYTYISGYLFPPLQLCSIAISTSLSSCVCERADRLFIGFIGYSVRLSPVISVARVIRSFCSWCRSWFWLPEIFLSCFLWRL